MTSAVGGSLGLGIGKLRILSHPYLVFSTEGLGIPLSAALQLSLCRIKHGRITALCDLVQKGHCQIRSCSRIKTILTAVRREKILTIVGHRISDLIFGNNILRKGRLGFRLLGCHR